MELKVIYIRVTDYEKEKLEKAAKKLGLTITSYCRMTLLKSVEGEACQK